MFEQLTLKQYLAENAHDIRRYADAYKSLPATMSELIELSKIALPLGSGMQYHVGAYNTAAITYAFAIVRLEDSEQIVNLTTAQLCFHASEILKIVDLAKDNDQHLTQSKAEPDDFCCGDEGSDSLDCMPGETSSK